MFQIKIDSDAKSEPSASIPTAVAFAGTKIPVKEKKDQMA
jgi:hypothetical protein